MIVWHDFITHRYAWNDLLNICDMTHWCEWHDYCNMTWSRQTWHSHTTHKSIWINKSSVNPKSTSNQSSKPCTVLQYPSRTEWHDCAIGLDHVKHVTHTQSHSISVCVCVCVFVCVFVCIYTCMCMYVHVCACVCMYADLHIYVHIYKTPVHFSSIARPRLQKTPAAQNLIGNEDKCVCLYVYTRVCACMCMCVRACVCMLIYIYMYIFTRLQSIFLQLLAHASRRLQLPRTSLAMRTFSCTTKWSYKKK